MRCSEPRSWEHAIALPDQPRLGSLHGVCPTLRATGRIYAASGIVIVVVVPKLTARVADGPSGGALPYRVAPLDRFALPARAAGPKPSPGQGPRASALTVPG